MNYNLTRAGGAFFALSLLISGIPVPAQAQSSEGTGGESLRVAASTSSRSQTSYTGRGLSSSVRKKINKLDDDEVKELSIPVLMGVAKANLSKNFGDDRDGGSRSHEGLDIMAPKGAYVVSPTAAVVTRVGTGGSAGTYVYTANPGGETFAYMHLDSIAKGLKSGTELSAGDLIGEVGNTGNASGGAPHLHFEIREGRKTSDPFPRLAREFTLEERAKALAEIVENDEDEAEDALALYRSSIIAMRAAGYSLPEALRAVPSTGGSAGIVLAGAPQPFARDLALGSRGEDVIALQAYLIADDAGPKAKALAEAGATGYFGPATMAALAEFQAAAGIAPASGYFGPLTRARLLAVI